MQARALHSLLPKQKARKATAVYNAVSVGSNPVEISRLHEKNSISYLRYKYQVAAAGELSVVNGF